MPPRYSSFLFALVGALALTAAASRSAATGDPGNAAETPPPDPMLFIVHFSIGPAWVAERPFSEQDHAREHSGNLRRLREEGALLLGARYGDQGMVILRSASEIAARAEIEMDAAVRAGVFTYEISELRPFFDGCVTREPVQGLPDDTASGHHPQAPPEP